MRICVIPARGGSKRIPRKNIKPFLGKPVIAYPIEAALASGLFDEVVISTDDSEIASVAKQLGATVPFERPRVLADDHTPTAPVLIHAIEWFEKQGHTVTEMTCMYPATPFITKELLKEAYQYWKNAGASYCFSVSEFPSAPQRALTLTEQGRLKSLQPQYISTRTQDLPKAYFDTGMFYLCDAQVFKNKVPLYSDASVPFVLPRHIAHDIDTNEDWLYAEKIYKFIQQEIQTQIKESTRDIAI